MAAALPSLEALIDLVKEQSAHAGELECLAEALVLAEELAKRGDRLVEHFVATSRHAGHSWAAIGERLGVSKQAAQKRWDRPDTPPSDRDGEWDNFVPPLRSAVRHAVDEAAAAGCESTGTEHLLAGLLHEPTSVAGQVLVALGLSLDQVRAALPAPTAASLPGSVSPPLSQAASVALASATACAGSLGHSAVGTEHLLVALGGDPSGGARRLLDDFGVEFANIKRELGRVAGGTWAGRAHRGRRRRKGTRVGRGECSFCGKGERQIKKLIAGPGVYICDECVELCVSIIENEGPGSDT